MREVTRAGLEIPACPLAFASHRGQRRDGDHHIRLSELIGVAVVGVATVSWRTDRQPRDRPFLCAGRENISFFFAGGRENISNSSPLQFCHQTHIL